MSNRGSILVVDDELGPRESLRMILKPIYDVYTAENGQEALHLINKEKVDLVTLDLKMPGIPGIDVLKEIKKTRSDIEVVIITGYGTLSNAIEAIRYGAVDFISKPFNVAEIIAIVSKTVERRNFNLRIKTLIDKVKGLRLMGENGQTEAMASFGLSADMIAESGNKIETIQESIRQFVPPLPPEKVSVNYLDFLKVLIYILESKEDYTNGHSERVSLYSGIIAQDLRLSPAEREDLQIATLLHDIGKIGLSNNLLEKKNLTEGDALDVRQHPIKGVQLIEPLAFSHNVTSAILHHHERWDGQGYPDGLSGEEIPMLARIICLADSYDAMTSDRPYREGLSTQQVKEEIIKNAGTQFDPQAVSLFVKHFNDSGALDPIYQRASVH